MVQHVISGRIYGTARFIVKVIQNSFLLQKNKRVTFNKEFHTEPLHLLFHLPLSVEAYNQFLLLENKVDNFQLTADKDWWTYIWGTSQFSSQKAYRHLLGHADTHPVFKWLWKSCCQNKHKVFFFFSRIRRRAVYHCIKKKKIVKSLQRGPKGAHAHLNCCCC